MRGVVVALAACLALPCAAAASGTVEPMGIDADGPALADDGVVFGHARPNAYQLVFRRHGLTKRRRVVLPPRARSGTPVARLAGSSAGFALSLEVRSCRHGDCSDLFDAFNGAFAARWGHPLTALVRDCPRHLSQDQATFSAPPVDVWEKVVAYADCDQAVHVRDEAGVDHSGLPVVADELRVAGPYVATLRWPDQLTLSNWRTGTILFTLDSVSEFDVDSDGTVAFTSSGDRDPRVAWASPAEPTPHVLVHAYTSGVRAAGARIAYGLPELDGGFTVEVRLRDGALSAAAYDPTAVGAPDFDGRRLAWITRPCRQEWVVLWNGAGTVPRPPAGQCPFPRIRRGSARLDKRGRLSVRLRCPTSRSLGCVVLVGSRNPAYGRKGDEALWDWQEYGAAPGATERVRFHRNADAMCRDARGRLRTQLVFSVFPRPGTARARRSRRPLRRTHAVTVSGPHRQAEKCA